MFWHLRWMLCWAFGHTGNATESGYHVCDRCGLHGYWSFRETSGDEVSIEYSNAGHLVNWWYRWQDRRENKRLDDELPF